MAKAAARLPKPAWQRMRTGAVQKGVRDHDWAMIAVTADDTPDGHDRDAGTSVLLARRHRYTRTVSYHRCLAPGPVPLARPVLPVRRRRRVEDGLVHHSDAGSQYTSVKFTESLALQGVAASIGSMGDAYDNALAESIIGLYKTEVVNRHGPFKTLAQVEYALMEWVDWYNNARLHSRLGYLTPAEYETAYYAQQPPRRPALV